MTKVAGAFCAVLLMLAANAAADSPSDTAHIDVAEVPTMPSEMATQPLGHDGAGDATQFFCDNDICDTDCVHRGWCGGGCQSASGPCVCVGPNPC